MSQENLDIVRANFEAFNAGDLDALREMFDPDVIVRAAEDWPEPGPFVGRDAVMRQGEQLRETWDAVTLEPISDFIDVGDRVAVRHIWRGVGRGPPEANLEFTVVYTIRKGRILGLDYFYDHAEALATMGLRESASAQSNVELVYRAFAAYNQRDLDAFLALNDDDVEAVPRVGLMEGSYHGHDGLRRWWEDLFGVYPDFEMEVVEVRDLGDLTLTTLRVRGHGAGSDIPLDDAIWSVGRWRQGKCVWWANFDTEAEALAVTGRGGG
jgi:ketosteroid isomerase-like protein